MDSDDLEWSDEPCCVCGTTEEVGETDQGDPYCQECYEETFL